MTCDVADAVDDLRLLIARAEAFASAAEFLFDDVVQVEDSEDRRHLERIAHLIGATSSAMQAVLEATDELAADLSTRRARA